MNVTLWYYVKNVYINKFYFFHGTSLPERLNISEDYKERNQPGETFSAARPWAGIWLVPDMPPEQEIDQNMCFKMRSISIA